MTVLLVNTAPLYVQGEVGGTVNFGKDITERKRAEDRLRALYENTAEALKRKVVELGQALATAERAHASLLKVERLRDEFVGMVSHDLRAPLNAMVMHAELLRTGGGQGRQARS